MNLPLFSSLLVLLLASGALAGTVSQSADWRVPPRSARKKNPVSSNESTLAAGRATYTSQCVSCHGESGKGDGPAAKDLEKHPGDLTSSVIQGQSDGALFWKISTGRAPMTAFKDALSAEQRWQVVTFIRTLSGSSAPLILPQFAATEAMRASNSALFDVYDACRSSLAKGDDPATLLAVKRMAGALGSLRKLDVTSLPKKSLAAWTSVIKSIDDSIPPLSTARDLKARRLAFAGFSKNAEALWAKFGHANPKPLQVFQMKNGATWVQRDAKPSSPYTSRPVKDPLLRRIAGKQPKRGNSAKQGNSIPESPKGGL